MFSLHRMSSQDEDDGVHLRSFLRNLHIIHHYVGCSHHKPLQTRSYYPFFVNSSKHGCECTKDTLRSHLGSDYSDHIRSWFRSLWFLQQHGCKFVLSRIEKLNLQLKSSETTGRRHNNKG